jgi:hypothetical protein
MRFDSPLFPLFDALQFAVVPAFLMRLNSPLLPLFDALLFAVVPAF